MIWMTKLHISLKKGKETKRKERKGKDGVQTADPSSCCCFVGQHYISRFMEKAEHHFST